MRADRIEVAQRDRAEARFGRAQVAQHLLDHQLAAAIGIGRRQRMRLGERQRARLAIDGGRRTEHQPRHALVAHGAQQRNRARDVVVVILERVGHRFADGLAAGQVQHRLHRLAAPRLARQQGLYQAGLADVALDQRDRRPAQALDPPHRLGAAVAEIVQHQRPLAGGQHRHQGVGADVAGAARDQHAHLAHGRLPVKDAPPRQAARHGAAAAPGRGRDSGRSSTRWTRRGPSRPRRPPPAPPARA